MQDTNFQTILDDRVELSLYDPAQSMIPDGFAANATIRYLPRRWYDQTVKDISWLRRATDAMWPRIYSVPNDINTIIDPYATYSTQYRIVPGSVIWGWDLVYLSGGGAGTTFVNVTDPYTQRSVFSSFVNAGVFSSSSNGKRPVVLSRPYQVDYDGLIDIQIRNNTAANMQCSLILLVSEPSASLAGTVVPPNELEVL